MKDKFEHFIEDNRSELDTFEPRKGLWESIDDRLHRQKELKRLRYYVAAASILLAVSVLAWLVSKPSLDNNATGTENIAINPELNKTEVYYTSMIEQKRNELKRYCSNQPRLCTEFGKELDTLNIMYGQLKQEYYQSTHTEVVLQAMINNLQLQVQILTQQLQIIQKIQSKNGEIKML